MGTCQSYTDVKTSSNIEILTALGHDEQQAAWALDEVNGNLNRAIHLLDRDAAAVDDVIGSSFDDLGAPFELRASETDNESLAQFLSMGFPVNAVTAALRRNNNNYDATLMDLTASRPPGGPPRVTPQGSLGDVPPPPPPPLDQRSSSEGLAAVGRSLFRQSSSGEGRLHDRFLATQNCRAGTLTEQLSLLKSVDWSYNNPDHWSLRVDGPSRTFSWARRFAKDPSVVEISEDTYIDLKSPGADALMETHAWIRTFLSPYRLDLQPASHPTRYSTTDSIPAQLVAELPHVRKSSLDSKKEWFDAQCASLRLPWSDRVRVHVSRENAFEESLELFRYLAPQRWRAALDVQFKGEAAYDAGGLTRDWFFLILRHAFSKECNMFRFAETDNITYTIDDRSDVPREYYRFVGCVLGKALLDGHAIGVHFSIPLLKFICGYPVTWHDVQFKDYQFYRSLGQLLTLSAEDLEAMCMDFTIPTHSGDVPLKPHGGNIPLTGDNIKDYVNLAAKFKLLLGDRHKLCALLRGIYEVIPEPMLTVFDYQELELFLGGVPTIDVEDWQRHTRVTGVAAKSVVKWFWQIVHDWDHENRAKFLQFATGTAQVPVGGFRNLQGHLGAPKNFELKIIPFVPFGIDRFPKGHTCFNRVDLPQYPTRGEMKECLEALLRVDYSTTGFGFD